MNDIDIEKMTSDKTKWADYQNGNYHVWLNLEDGTKIRHTEDDEFKAAFPESMDIKITNACDRGCPMCFIAGTKILMGDLTYKNIEDVQIGDVIMGFEEKSGKFGMKRKMMPSKVLNTFVHVESELVKVATEESSVTATPNHPFLSEGTGANHSQLFNQIGRIPVGKYLFNCSFPLNEIDKSLDNYLSQHFQYYKREMISKQVINKKQYVYNLETECHTYIANNFLVHNCHEDSRLDGAHSDISQPFIDTLHPYQEIAVGGGNVLSHPRLEEFLAHLRELKCVPSITVNQAHFMKDFDRIKKLYDDGLVFGIGVSLTDAHDPLLIERLQQLPTAVVHTIVGLLSPDDVMTLAGHGLKVLLLGYKDIRRGHDYLSRPEVSEDVKKNTFWVAMNLPQMMRAFKVLSFDNLALEQLPVRQVVGEEIWQQFYMGDDGRHTFYIDMVEQEFARSSTSMNRHGIDSKSIDEMFQLILAEKDEDDARG